MNGSRYDWAGFGLHFALGALLGTLFALGFRLLGLSAAAWLPAVLTARADWADVIGSALVLGLLGGIFRDRLWFWWLRSSRWSRE